MSQDDKERICMSDGGIFFEFEFEFEICQRNGGNGIYMVIELFFVLND